MWCVSSTIAALIVTGAFLVLFSMIFLLLGTAAIFAKFLSVTGVVSTLTGRLSDGNELRTAGYWVRQVRATVRFSDGVRALADAGRVWHGGRSAGGWHTAECDGLDAGKVERALDEAIADERPSLIRCKTIIGYGAPTKKGTADVHGAPLGAEEIAGARAALGWEHEPFVIPESIKDSWDARERGFQAESQWKEKLVAYEEEFPVLAMELIRRIKGEMPGHFAERAERDAALVLDDLERRERQPFDAA